MPNSGLSDIQLAHQACTRAGLDPPADLDGDNAEQVVLRASMETTIRASLGHYRYSWARIERELIVDANPPLQRWDAAFLLPADCLEVQTFRVNDTPTDFHRYNQYLFVDSDEDQANVLVYMFRPITSQWPPTFTNGIIWRLAALLVAGVKEDPKGAKDLETIAEAELIKAQFADSSGQTTGGFDLSGYASVRRGGSRRRLKR